MCISIYCSHTFLSQNTLCFSFGMKDMITAFTCFPSYRYSSFTLREYLCWRHTYCQWPLNNRKERISQEVATWSRFIRMRVFRGVTTCHVAVPTGNTSFATKHFRPSSAAEKVSTIRDTNNHVKSEMLSNRHTQTRGGWKLVTRGMQNIVGRA